MKIPDFRLERYFAAYEFKAPYLLCCSDCESLTVQELLSPAENAEAGLGELWLGYTESQGHPDLRLEISKLYAAILPEQILVHSGAEEAIFNFMHAFLETGDHIIVHAPGYQSLFEVARSMGCRVTEWKASPENNWDLDLDFLKTHLEPNTRAVVVNCPHNPTGYLMGKNPFRELAALSERHGFILFSDEVYRFLEYRAEDRLPALCDIDERGVSLGVMSKSFGLAGLRIGWVATRNRDLFRAMASFKDYTTICNSAPSEYLAIVALRNKEKILSRNLRIIEENLKLLNGFFERNPGYFDWVPPKAGPIAFPRLHPPWQAEAFCRNLVDSTGVLLLPGTLFDPTYNHVRIGFGRRNLPACVEQLEHYLNDLQ